VSHDQIVRVERSVSGIQALPSPVNSIIVQCAVANSNLTNYIFLRLVINTMVLSWYCHNTVSQLMSRDPYIRKVHGLITALLGSQGGA